MTHNKEMAREFLTALDPDATRFTFQFISDAGTRHTEIFHVSLDEVWPKVEALNNLQQRCGVFVTPNATDFKGRKKSNIVRARALFVDADGREQVEHCESVLAASGIAASMLVRTGRGAHYYFSILGDVPLDGFSDRQQSLIETLGTDPSIKDLPRVMRLPGTLHLKDPSQPRLVTLEPCVGPRPRYSPNDLLQALGTSKPVTPSSPSTPSIPKVVQPNDFTPDPIVQELFRNATGRLSDGLEADVEKIRSAALAIPSSANATELDWVRIARALAREAAIFPKSEPQLWAILDEISRSAPNYDKEDNRRRWDRYQREAHNSDRPITIATLFDLASKHGWRGYVPLTPSPNPTSATPPPWSPGDLSVTFSNIRHRPMLYGFDLVRGEITVLASPGGLGKSSLAIGMAVSIVTGKEILDEKIRGSDLKVLLINAEDSTDEIRRRVWAFCRAHNVAEHELGRLYAAGADDPRVQALSFLRTNQKGQSELNASGFAQLRLAHQNLSPDVIILDPLVALCASGNMNDNASMSLVMRALKTLAAEFDCAVLLVHHTRKNAEAGAADAISGAASIVNLARRAIMPVTVSTEEATPLGILPSERLRHFKLVDAKSNLAPRSSDVPIYRLQGVELPNAELPIYPFGDNVQAVVRVHPQSQASAVVSMDDQKIRRAILDLVARGKVIDGKVYPYSPNTTGAANVRSILDDAVAAARGATAPGQWAPGDLEAVVAMTIKKLLKDGTLVFNEITGTGRFRRGQGLQVNPSLTTNGDVDASGTKSAA
jgi:hypothetical protein